MDQKALISNVVTAVVTAVVLGIAGWALGVFNAGSAALDEAQIETVIKRVMVLDDNQTYAAALTSINIHLGSIDTSLGHIQGDIRRIDGAVAALAAE